MNGCDIKIYHEKLFGGMSMKRWKVTLKMAIKQVDIADNEDLDIRVQYSGMAIENFLKSILMKSGKYVDEHRNGDRHHICLELYNKIKREGCLDSEIISEIEDILINKRLIYMDTKYYIGRIPVVLP